MMLCGNIMDLGVVFGMYVLKILYRDEVKIIDIYFFFWINFFVI